jgi:transcription antitermination factor NusG
MSEEKQWHAWVIKRQRMSEVVGFIKDYCPEVDKYFYPFIKKEYVTRTGLARIKDVPLYEGYLFLRYSDHPVVFHKLQQYPQVTTYCGPVNPDEIEHMRRAQGKLLTELKSSRFFPGDLVVLKEGPFKGWDARVISVSRGVVKAKVEATILGFSGHEIVCSEDNLERQTELRNADVQDIL